MDQFTELKITNARLKYKLNRLYWWTIFWVIVSLALVIINLIII